MKAMPFSAATPGSERYVIVLACVAMTERPMVPHFVVLLPLR
jgi:hypothetical protein